MRRLRGVGLRGVNASRRLYASVPLCSAGSGAEALRRGLRELQRWIWIGIPVAVVVRKPRGVPAAWPVAGRGAACEAFGRGAGGTGSAAPVGVGGWIWRPWRCGDLALRFGAWWRCWRCLRRQGGYASMRQDVYVSFCLCVWWFAWAAALATGFGVALWSVAGVAGLGVAVCPGRVLCCSLRASSGGAVELALSRAPRRVCGLGVVIAWGVSCTRCARRCGCFSGWWSGVRPGRDRGRAEWRCCGRYMSPAVVGWPVAGGVSCESGRAWGGTGRTSHRTETLRTSGGRGCASRRAVELERWPPGRACGWAACW